MTISNETLMAFVDGELEGADHAAVERALAGDAELRARVEAQRRLRAALAGHYAPVAAEPVPDRLLAMLGASRPENVTSLADARERRRPSGTPAWRNYGAIAATLAVGIIAGQLVPRGTTDPITIEQGLMVARGDLAEALETQLASAQVPTDATRIGVTFADRAGRACRTFDRSATSGLACRERGEWRVLMAAASDPQQTQYRQAGSSSVLQVAQEMMAGRPLDAAAERATMEAGWKISAARAD